MTIFKNIYSFLFEKQVQILHLLAGWWLRGRSWAAGGAEASSGFSLWVQATLHLGCLPLFSQTHSQEAGLEVEPDLNQQLCGIQVDRQRLNLLAVALTLKLLFLFHWKITICNDWQIRTINISFTSNMYLSFALKIDCLI